MKVLNMGSLNLDYAYQVDHILTGGETLASGGMESYCGGKGLNQSVALARAGVAVYHAGLVGEDGEKLLETCRENGVDTRFIRTTQGKSGHTVIQVDRSGQNCILLYGGSNRLFTEAYIDEVLGHFSDGDLLLIQNEINLLEYVVDRAYERGMKIILNPSPLDEGLKKTDLNKISLFLMNEVEAAGIFGTSSWEEIWTVIDRKFPRAETVVTLGSRGSVYQGNGKRFVQRAFPVRAVDTTGAGDTYTGYYIAGMLKGMSIPEILEFASRASALAVMKKGAVPSIPFLREVEHARLESGEETE